MSRFFFRFAFDFIFYFIFDFSFNIIVNSVSAGEWHQNGSVLLVLNVVSIFTPLLVGFLLQNRNSWDPNDQNTDENRTEHRQKLPFNQTRNRVEGSADPQHDFTEVVWVSGNRPESFVDKFTLIFWIFFEGRLLVVRNSFEDESKCPNNDSDDLQRVYFGYLGVFWDDYQKGWCCYIHPYSLSQPSHKKL